MYDIRVNVYLVEKLHFSLSSFSPSLIRFVCFNSFKLTIQSTKCMSFVLNLAFFYFTLYFSSSSRRWFFLTFIYFYSNPFLDDVFFVLFGCQLLEKVETLYHSLTFHPSAFYLMGYRLCFFCFVLFYFR